MRCLEICETQGDYFPLGSVVIPKSTALKAAREEGNGTSSRPGTWPGGGPEPPRAVPAGRLPTQRWKLDCETSREAAWNLASLSGAPWNTAAGEGETASEPDTGARATTAAEGGRPRAPRLAARGASARRGEVGGGRGDPSPRESPARVHRETPAPGGLATVTQRARGRQAGRAGAARPAPRRAGAAVPEGGAGRAGESGRQPPVSISARSCGGGEGSGAAQPGARRRGGGAAAAGAQARRGRPRPRRCGEEPGRGATAGLTTERGRRSVCSRERAQGSARAGARRPCPPLPSPPPPALPLPTFLSAPAPPRRAPTLSSSCGSAVRGGGWSGPGRAGGWRCWTWPWREWPSSGSSSSWCCG